MAWSRTSDTIQKFRNSDQNINAKYMCKINFIYNGPNQQFHKNKDKNDITGIGRTTTIVIFIWCKIVKVGVLCLFVLDIWEGWDNAGIVPTSAYLGKEMRGWSVFVNIRSGLAIENINIPRFLGMRKVRDQKWKRWKSISDSSALDKQCLLWNPLTSQARF